MSDKKPSRAQAVRNLESAIIKECKKLATFKVSSAAKINELTKELLTLENGLVEDDDEDE